MSAYPIREAQPGDVEEVYAIFLLADNLHRQAHPEIFQEAERPADVRNYFRASLRADDAVIFVAEDRGKIIGAILAWVRLTPEIPLLVRRTYLSIENLVVANEYRQQGVGRALMAQMHLWAAERSLTEIQLTVWNFNQPAIAFYEKLGYEMLHHRMRKELP